MPDPEAGLWVSQAESDRYAAVRIFDAKIPRSYCQTIAKCQQTVEKSVKAIAAALHDGDVLTIDRSHYYKHDLEKLITALLLTPKSSRATDIQSRIIRLFNDFRRTEIKALSALAPRRPDSGQLHARNTEYPYQNPRGDWTAPALSGSFDIRDVDRFSKLAEHIYQGARQIVSALRRR